MSALKKVVLGLALVVVGFVLFRLLTVGEPQIIGAERFAKLGANAEVRLVVKGPERISAVRVEIGQEGVWHPLLEDTRPERSKELVVAVDPRALGLSDGDATVRIEAQGAWFRTTTSVLDVVVDTVPPSLSIVDATRWVKQGGAGAVHLKASDAEEVVVEDNLGTRFAARRLRNDGGEDWVALLGVPLSDRLPETFFAVARDDAGNTVRAELPTSIRAADFPVQTIHLSDAFIDGKVRPMLGAEGEGLGGVDAFRRVNEGWRSDDEATFRKLGTMPPSGLLWEGAAFSRLRNGKAMAQFGDFRRYYYGTNEVSTSRHLGCDLASVKHADVPAAASGTVVFAGPLKIYGNTVVLDHGLGLMTLYSHLSEFLVQEGAVVARDVPVARTGSTGFAFGDHLHFGVLVAGFEVNPLEWWDEEWIANSLSDPLQPAFPKGIVDN